MYSLSAFFILSSRAPPNTSAAAFITPPQTRDNDQPEEDIIKTPHHKKYMVEDNRSFIMNEGLPSGFLSWPDISGHRQDLLQPEINQPYSHVD